MTAHMSPVSTPGPTKYVTVTFLADVSGPNPADRRHLSWQLMDNYAYPPNEART